MARVSNLERNAISADMHFPQADAFCYPENQIYANRSPCELQRGESSCITTFVRRKRLMKCDCGMCTSGEINRGEFGMQRRIRRKL